MRLLAAAIAAFCLSSPGSAASSKDPQFSDQVPQLGEIKDGRWRLVWADEFATDGVPDPDNWTYEQGMVRNHEAQNYTPDNATIKDGILTIEARREPSGNANYSSSSIHTGGKRQFLYGRFEARLKIDPRSGSWPAFWTLGSAITSVGWPRSGEIDIMEYYRGNVLANICRQDGQWSSTQTSLATLGGERWADQFHIWAMEWDARRIDLFLDDQLVNHYEVAWADSAGGDNPFRHPQYLILNLALGGDNGGDPSHTRFPVRYQVDYVRVYQEIPQ